MKNQDKRAGINSVEFGYTESANGVTSLTPNSLQPPASSFIATVATSRTFVLIQPYSLDSNICAFQRPLGAVIVQ